MRFHLRSPLTKYLLAVLVLLVLCTAAGAIEIVTHAAGGTCPRATDTRYRVVAGDTLSGIAVAHGTTVEQLADYNHLANPRLIFPTQAVCIPTGTLPSGRMTPMSREQYIAIARQAAQDAGIDPGTFVRQIEQESGFHPTDEQGNPLTSPAGARGIAQFEPGTARGLGINPDDPVQSLYGAARLMAGYVKQYGSIDKALAAYNAGSGNLMHALTICGAGWQQCIPVETQRYLQRILGQ